MQHRCQHVRRVDPLCRHLFALTALTAQPKTLFLMARVGRSYDIMQLHRAIMDGMHDQQPRMVNWHFRQQVTCCYDTSAQVYATWQLARQQGSRLRKVVTSVNLAHITFQGQPNPCPVRGCTDAHECYALFWDSKGLDPVAGLFGQMGEDVLVQLLPYRCIVCYQPTRRRCPCKTVMYCSEACQRSDRNAHRAHCPKNLDEENYDVLRRRSHHALRVIMAPM